MPDLHLKAISQIMDAALEPQRWASALDAVAYAFGVSGASCAVRNSETKGATWAVMVGAASSAAEDYVKHYASLDPWGALLDGTPTFKSMRLLQTLDRSVLARDEWYNDYLLKIGVHDLYGAVVDRHMNNSLLFGLFGDCKERAMPSRSDPRFALMSKAVQRAVQIGTQLKGLHWKSALAEESLNQLSAGVIVVENDGHVLQMNKSACQIVNSNDGLVVRSDRLCARRGSESARLSQLIAAATSDECKFARASKMSIARSAEKEPYFVTIVPLKVEVADHQRPLAIVLVSKPNAPSIAECDLTSLFGLSQAELRIANGLMRGKSLLEIAQQSEIKITTVRTQLRSILLKVGAKRQIDLVRILASVNTMGGNAGRE